MTSTHLLDLIAASSATVAEQIEIRRAFEAYCDGEWKREQEEREGRIAYWTQRETVPAPAPTGPDLVPALSRSVNLIDQHGPEVFNRRANK